MASVRGHEIATIDVVMVTLKPQDSETEIMLNTASQIGISVQSSTEDAIKLVVKGRLIAQKPSTTTITGNTITLTDNVFTPELAQILQGGTIEYWADAAHTSKVAEDKGFGVASYTPPAVDAPATEKGKPSTLCAYSAQYDTSGIIQAYERITYPNCQGTPVGLTSEDGVFRVAEYTINSAPGKGEAPYKIDYLKPDELPLMPEYVTPTGGSV